MGWQWQGISEQGLEVQTPQQVADEYRKRYDTMTTKTSSTQDGTERMLAYYKSNGGLSPELAHRIVGVSGPAPTPPAPTPDELAARISTTPDAHSPGLRALAAAYESQRERIADLEDDVERLRPREAFVVEEIFSHRLDGCEVTLETERHGGLTITAEDSDSVTYVVLPKAEVTTLTTALVEWSGVEVGVKWRSIADERPDSDERVLFIDEKNSDLVCGGYFPPGLRPPIWAYEGARPTHWAPLPKPPEST